MNEFKELILKEHKVDSFTACTLIQEIPENERHVIANGSFLKPSYTNGLHMMNATYLYTNPPPYGYGTPAPFVASTVNRAYDYVLKFKEDAEENFCGYPIINAAISTLENYPTGDTTGTYHPKTVELYTMRFLNKFTTDVTTISKEVTNWMISSNADILSRGRQTWDPELQKSTTCAKAYNSFVMLLKNNLGKIPTTLLECLTFWYEMYQNQSLTVKTRITKKVPTTKYVKSMNTRVTIQKRKIYYKRTKISGKGEVTKWLNDYARSFCSYIKHAERGKKDRRAIASGSIPLRLHLKIIEEFHLRLSKRIPGSTIAIGGEEKKKKIANELDQSTIEFSAAQPVSMQATEDATKWNECLNPMLFAILHKVLFDNKYRQQMNLPTSTEEEETLLRVFNIGFFYMLIKRIHLGIGYILQNESFYTRIPWQDTKIEYLSEHNQEWFKQIQDKIEDGDYVRASPGFLMGMLNAASTTVGLIPIFGIEKELTSIKSLRSSDDSMTVFTANGAEELEQLITFTYTLYKTFGINPSMEKTIIFPPGYGEYTSWYQDKTFIGQCGVETSSLKPGGSNVQDDLNSTTALTLTLMRTYIINAFGAIARIAIGINNCKKLWNIKLNVHHLYSPSPKVLFIADGGTNPWVIENLALDEATIRFQNIETDTDREYFMRIMAQDNPFSEPPEEELLYSRDLGTIVSAVRENPRNIFTFIRKSNRTHNTASSEEERKRERANQEAFAVSINVDPSFILHIPNSKAQLSRYLASNLIVAKEEHGFTSDEKELIKSAIFKLTTTATGLLDKEKDKNFEDELYNFL